MNRLCPICSKPFISIDGLCYCEEDHLYADLRPTRSSYNDLYWLHYKLYEKTPLSKQIFQARQNLILDYFKEGVLLDFGCGARTFERFWKVSDKGEKIKVYSYDPYFYPNHNFLKEDHIDALTFWDSFEHIERLPIVKEFQAEFIFITLPIIDNVENIFCWKHYVPYEHIWMFSTKALINLMTKWNYTLVTHAMIESHLRSEDIQSFVFKRVIS